MKKKKTKVQQKAGPFLKKNSPNNFMIALAVVVLFFAIMIVQGWL